MSEIINANFPEDLPCYDWQGTRAEVHDCPIKNNWQEGQTVLCLRCGWQIYCNNQQQNADPVSDTIEEAFANAMKKAFE